MLYLNEYDISDAIRKHASHPVLSKAARFLARFKDEVNAHSDGWAYWKPPVKAAAKLMTLLQGQNATEEQFKAALVPIKSFYTRRGNAAGMVFPNPYTNKFTVGNQFGYLCPKCHRGDCLGVSFHGSCLLTPDGTDDSGAHDWDKDSMAWCNACNWDGRVRDLEQAENFEEE